MSARGKPVFVSHHAYGGMVAERPSIRDADVFRVLEDPDHDTDGQAWARIGRRTVIVYYDEDEDAIRVRSVSATRRRLDS